MRKLTLTIIFYLFLTACQNSDTSTNKYSSDLHPEIQKLLKDMVLVEGGTFRMGCIPERDGDCDDDQKPAHKVTLDDYSIGKYEVTQAQWEVVMGINPSVFKNCPNCPVEYVNWNDIQDFFKELKSMTGESFRLPTEAEWEFAARGGNKSQDFKYAGSHALAKVAWYSENSEDKTQPVGTKQGNELGLYDMSGNVFEWCSDWYGENYYANSPSKNPSNTTSKTIRVLRGGSWVNNDIGCRSTVRFNYSPTYGLNYFGFRCAKTP